MSSICFSIIFVAFNATQSAVQTAVRDMQIYGSSVVTAGATNVNTTTSLTLTVTRMQDFDTITQGAIWSFITSSLRSATGPLFPSVTDTGESTQVEALQELIHLLYIYQSLCFSRSTLTEQPQSEMYLLRV